MPEIQRHLPVEEHDEVMASHRIALLQLLLHVLISINLGQYKRPSGFHT